LEAGRAPAVAIHRPLRVLSVLGCFGLLVGLLTAPATAAADGRRSYSGTIDAARFRVETPERWTARSVPASVALTGLISDQDGPTARLWTS
jgi:hypothetical protein